MSLKIVEVKTNHHSLSEGTIMPKHCVAVSCTNHNFMHKKKLPFFRFPNKLKQSKQRGKWVQAVKRVNSDASKWEPHRNYVNLYSDHFPEGTITYRLKLVNQWVDLWLFELSETVFCSTLKGKNQTTSQHCGHSTRVYLLTRLASYYMLGN